MHASSSVVIFIRQGLFFSELSTSSLSLLDPYSDYVGVNISLNNSLLSFLNVYAPSLFAPPQQMAEPTPFSLHSSLQKSLILGDFNCHHPLWDSRGTSDPVGRKYSTGSSPLTSSLSMILTHPPFLVAALLTSALLPFLATGRCFRTWVLMIYQFFYLSLSLWLIAPTSIPLTSIFRKLAGMTLLYTLTRTVLL